MESYEREIEVIDQKLEILRGVKFQNPAFLIRALEEQKRKYQELIMKCYEDMTPKSQFNDD